MSKEKNKIPEINTVTELHRFFGLPKPMHPLVSVIRFDDVSFTLSDVWEHFVNNLYSVSVKRGEPGKVKYGQTLYDFDEGIMTLIAPRQVISIENTQDIALSGYKLTFHPDFIQSYSLAKTIKEYGFFSYTANKALFLSEKEEQIILRLMKAIEQEYQSNIDQFSQDVMIANIELLLVHVDRYYNRQFITRKSLSNDRLAKMENLLNDYFNNETIEQTGLPTVKHFANQLYISPTYLAIC